ncbi:DMT family transporter [Achromobacter sp. 413638]|uniref:DMT family transporter n=1 Tax=Achromobacter sp. 413638 TaxID=3342385 RepID=UPI0032557801
MTPRLFALTLLSLLAFAGNSLLCRIALKQTPIDPTSFVAIRLLSGALILWLVLYLQRQSRNLEGSWFGALALLAYAMTFAYAYSQIPAGTGALLLFASIQISMILYGLIIGERLSFLQSIGVAFAVSGLVMLMLPSVGAPPLFYGFLMIVSGIAWSAYSVAGRGSRNPASATAGNFIRATPIALVLFLLQFQASHVDLDPTGVIYAVASGAVTSGLGYILWYAALKELKVTHAATVQLSVPVLTAFGGALFLGEAVTQILVAASALIILGVSLVVLVKRRA